MPRNNSADTARSPDQYTCMHHAPQLAGTGVEYACAAVCCAVYAWKLWQILGCGAVVGTVEGFVRQDG